jgi:hypothetical protein
MREERREPSYGTDSPPAGEDKQNDDEEGLEEDFESEEDELARYADLTQEELERRVQRYKT